MLQLYKIYLLPVLVCLLLAQTSSGQEKPAKNKEEVKKPIKIIYETEPARERKKTEILHLYETRETVIKANTDTTLNTEKIDTTIVIRKGTPIKAKNTMESGDFCKCVDMAIKAPDTLEYNQYLNYSFIFTNKCGEPVVIYSSGFTAKPYNIFGSPAKVLRKVSFVKRFDLPEFIILAPKDSFAYRLADDVFFEFDIQKSQRYKFIFTSQNSVQKQKATQKKTHSCPEVRERVIFVK